MLILTLPITANWLFENKIKIFKDKLNAVFNNIICHCDAEEESNAQDVVETKLNVNQRILK